MGGYSSGSMTGASYVGKGTGRVTVLVEVVVWAEEGVEMVKLTAAGIEIAGRAVESVIVVGAEVCCSSRKLSMKSGSDTTSPSSMFSSVCRPNCSTSWSKFAGDAAFSAMFTGQ